LTRLAPDGRNRGVEVVDLPGGIRVRLVRPAHRGRARPALLWMHGGGYVLGSAKLDDDLCLRFSDALGITVASVEYRLAPEHTYPAALEDCYRALSGLRQLPDVDPARVAIGGASAGGGLAAALALMCRDRKDIPPVFQLLVYPMLDDRTISQRRAIERKRRLWNIRSNEFAWRAYLGDADPGKAVPARHTDLSDLPPAWIGVGTLDLFCEESLAYAAQLKDVGISCEVEVVPGAFHSFDRLTADAEVSNAFFRSQCSALAKHLGVQSKAAQA
jgi:acetyl esterase/lipase